jgi:hypothetical protein
MTGGPFTILFHYWSHYLTELHLPVPVEHSNNRISSLVYLFPALCWWPQKCCSIITTFPSLASNLPLPRSNNTCPLPLTSPRGSSERTSMALVSKYPAQFHASTNFVTSGVFRDVTPCDSCKSRRFGGISRLHNQGDKNRWASSQEVWPLDHSIEKLYALRSFL